jgi:hypothetical protein
VVLQSGHPRWFFLSTTSDLLIYDLTDPRAPKQAGRLPLPTWENEDIDVGAGLALMSHDVPVAGPDSPVGGQLVVVDTSDPTKPLPLGNVSLPDGAGHTATCLDGCRWAYASNGATLAAVDLSNPAAATTTRVPRPAASGSVHDVDQDGDGIVWLSGEVGISAVAVHPVATLGSRVARLSATASVTKPVVLTTTGAPGTSPGVRVGILHNSQRPRDIAYRGFSRGEVLLASEESTAADCRDGGRFHTFDARGLRTGAPLRVLDSVAPAELKASVAPGLGAGCSAHWFTTNGPLAAVAWYGAGLRLLDVTDPTHVRQVGRYVPQEPRTWSAYWVPGTQYVYALDLNRGIDVLEVTAHPGAREVAPLDHHVKSLTLTRVVSGAVCSSATT